MAQRLVSMAARLVSLAQRLPGQDQAQVGRIVSPESPAATSIPESFQQS